MKQRFIGLMSGTSLDGIDGVLVEFNQQQLRQVDALTLPFSEPELSALRALCTPGDNEIERLALADPMIARKSAEVVDSLLERQQLTPSDITAIGSHGQTVRHHPELGYSLQIGDPNLLAELTGICVVADFRRRDLAAGGQGAPLVPAFHAEQFRSTNIDRIIVNIGGISNISVLPQQQNRPVIGFDTGPGNLLLDYWYQRHQNGLFDKGGQWARSGSVSNALLHRWLCDPYIQAPYPKSTGRERFNPAWLIQQLDNICAKPEDIQATLCRFTAASIAHGIASTGHNSGEIYLCGGGAHNLELQNNLAKELPAFHIQNTDILGIEANWVEGAAFAWLAKRTLEGKSGNLASATHARGERILGGIYPA